MTEKQKIALENKRRTKREILSKIKNKDNIIQISSNKRKTNITVNTDVLDMIEKNHTNRSELIEKLLIKLLEEELNKKIEITKAKGI